MIPTLSALDKDPILFSNTHKESGLQVIPNSSLPPVKKKKKNSGNEQFILFLVFALEDVNYQKFV